MPRAIRRGRCLLRHRADPAKEKNQEYRPKAHLPEGASFSTVSRTGDSPESNPTEQGQLPVRVTRQRPEVRTRGAQLETTAEVPWLESDPSRGRLSMLMALLVKWFLDNTGRNQWFPVAARQRTHQIAVHPSDELGGVSPSGTPLHILHDSCNCRSTRRP